MLPIEPHRGKYFVAGLKRVTTNGSAAASSGSSLRCSAGHANSVFLRDRGADLDRVATIGDDIELGDARTIDQNADIDQPQIKHRQQRLPAGQNARVVAVLGEQRQRLVDAIGPRIIEGARFH